MPLVQKDGFSVIMESREDSDYPIRPRDIHTDEYGCITRGFNKHEIERAAGHIVSLYKQIGYWRGITREELARFYVERGRGPVDMFYGLTEPWHHYTKEGFVAEKPVDTFFWKTPNGVYFVTDRFVRRCAGAIVHNGILYIPCGRDPALSKDTNEPREIGAHPDDVLLGEDDRETRNAEALITRLVREQYGTD